MEITPIQNLAEQAATQIAAVAPAIIGVMSASLAVTVLIYAFRKFRSSAR